MKNEKQNGPDVGAGEPFAFRLQNKTYKDRIYVCVTANVCDNPACSCRDLGMAIYDNPGAGRELSSSPLYTFVLDLKNRSLQEEYPVNEESRGFAVAFLDHTTRDHWPLYEKAFTTLKNQAMEKKKIIKGTSDSIAGQMVSLDQGKPGRNDPCACGSGKKYKNCCGS